MKKENHYIIRVERHFTTRQRNGEEIPQCDSISFSDNQIGALLEKKGLKAMAETVLPCEACKYENRSVLQRPCFDCRRSKPDLYESIYEGMQS